MKIISSPVVPLNKSKVRPGGWLATGNSPPKKSVRDRLGWSFNDNVTASTGGISSFYATNRSLFPEQYWQLYRSTPDVRACVDSITRRIATWDWYVKVNADPRDTVEYSRLSEQANKVRNFLALPNTDGTTWQEMMTAMVTDLLLYDAGVIELVKDESGRMSELQVWLGSEFMPVKDERGHLLYYEQDPESSTGEPVQIAPEDIAYFKIYSNTRSPLGLPMMETVINECVTVVLASEHAMLALDADEIPPGLLVLGGISGPAAERARTDLMAMKGKDHRIRVVTSPQPSGIDAKWLELRHTPKDLELLQVVAEMRRSIWRVFGVMPVELGETAGVPRAAAEIQMDVSSSHLISPILELIQARINAQIVPKLIDPEDMGKLSFTFDRIAPSTAEEKLSMAKRAESLIRQGVLTVNEARSEMGLMPIEGGDIAMVTTSYGPMPLSQVAAGYSPAVTVPMGDAAFASLDGGATVEEGGVSSGGTPDPVSATPSETLSVKVPTKGSPGKEKGWRSAMLYDPGLPSHWANPETFKGERTLNLRDLASAVREYTFEIASLYGGLADEIGSIVASSYRGGSISLEISSHSRARMDEAFSAFVARWEMATTRHYINAANIGYDAAIDFMNNVPDIHPTQEALAYQSKAIQYLEDSSGLVGTLRQKIGRILEAATLSQRDRSDQVSPEDTAEEVMLQVDEELKAQSYRIKNWSGKLVALASLVMVGALRNTVTIESGKPVIWKYEWRSQSGDNCVTCTTEGGSGKRLLSDLSTYPAADTKCGAKCRCVLVIYKSNELTTIE